MSQPRPLPADPNSPNCRVTSSELEALNRSQIATGSSKHRDIRFPPFAFAEQDHGEGRPRNPTAKVGMQP
jgi:hypothetical protein